MTEEVSSLTTQRQLLLNLLNPTFHLSSNLVGKFNTMLLFAKVCNEEYLLVQVSNFLDISELLKFLNLDKHLRKFMKLEEIQLRILKSKVRYHEKKKQKKIHLLDISFLPFHPQEEQSTQANQAPVNKIHFIRKIKDKKNQSQMLQKNVVLQSNNNISKEINKIREGQNKNSIQGQRKKREKLSYTERLNSEIDLELEKAIRKDIELEKKSKAQKRKDDLQARFIVIQPGETIRIQEETILEKLKDKFSKFYKW